MWIFAEPLWRTLKFLGINMKYDFKTNSHSKNQIYTRIYTYKRSNILWLVLRTENVSITPYAGRWGRDATKITKIILISCSQAVSKSVLHMPLLCVQWKTPDDGQRNRPKHVQFHSKNKFEKSVHLVGFIIRICHDARSHERQIYQNYIYRFHYKGMNSRHHRTGVLNHRLKPEIDDNKRYSCPCPCHEDI
jgi:hypothetical protein